MTFDVQADTTWLVIWSHYQLTNGSTLVDFQRHSLTDIDSITYTTTLISSTPGTGVTDIDGNSYGTTVIGNGQEWMAENLRTTRYANGDWIENIEDVSDFNDATIGAWCHFENDFGYDQTYGKLYNWYAVDDPRNVCPDGWHVPDTADYGSLLRYIENWSFPNPAWPNEYGAYFGTIATADVLITEQSSWFAGIYPAHYANNATGFSITQTGVLSGSSFSDFPVFWTSTATPGQSVYQLLVHYNYFRSVFLNTHAYIGCSIRCIKDQ